MILVFWEGIMSNAIVTQEQGKQFQLSQDKIDLIKRTICKGASNDELALFVEQCDRTGLDPFARQIYSIRRRQWNSATRQNEEAQVIQVSIDGFRLIADRTHKYAGQVGPWWCGKDGEWREVWLADEPPAAAKVGVLRSDFQQPAYGIALYKAYVQTNSQGDPVSRWKTDPAGMLAKCAEALALRKAFPHELSGLYTTEEMTQADNNAVTTTWEPAPDQTKLPAGANGKAADYIVAITNDEGHTEFIEPENYARTTELEQPRPTSPIAQPVTMPTINKPSQKMKDNWSGLFTQAKEYGLTVESLDMSTISAEELAEKGKQLRQRIEAAKAAVEDNDPVELEIIRQEG
jgi:phage recombination protein Bet